MNVLRILQCFIIIAFSISFNTEAVIVRYAEQSFNSTRMSDQEGFVSCTCNGKTDKQKLLKGEMADIFTSMKQRDFCVTDKENTVCKMMETCYNCTAEVQKCKPFKEEKNLFVCTKKQLIARDSELITKVKGIINHSRTRRQVMGCGYPKNLKTADLLCTKYPSSTKCLQKCIFGHTLKEGITRKLSCQLSEGKWKPTGFEECQPFIDCTMTLVSTGNLTCVTATTKKAPVCSVMCDRYEDKSAVPMKDYECKISGGWEQKLPFCVTAGSALDLVDAPRVKLHKP